MILKVSQTVLDTCLMGRIRYLYHTQCDETRFSIREKSIHLYHTQYDETRCTPNVDKHLKQYVETLLYGRDAFRAYIPQRGCTLLTRQCRRPHQDQQILFFYGYAEINYAIETGSNTFLQILDYAVTPPFQFYSGGAKANNRDSSEWKQFLIHGYTYQTKTYLPLEVPGDGNCFFHSVVEACKRTTVLHPSLLAASSCRDHVCQEATLSYRCFAVEMYNLQERPSVGGFDRYMVNCSKDGTYAGQLEALILYRSLGLNCIMISNTSNGISVFDPNEFVTQHHPIDCVKVIQTILVYHHFYGSPITQYPMAALNHFCSLVIPTKAEIRAMQQRRRRENEAPQKRQSRLEQLRQYNKTRLLKAPVISDSGRLECPEIVVQGNKDVLAKHQRQQRDNETHLQRQMRLEQLREYNKTRLPETSNEKRHRKRVLSKEAVEQRNERFRLRNERQRCGFALLSQEACDALDSDRFLTVPDSVAKKAIYSDVRQLMGDAGLGERPCLVCDRFRLSSKVEEYTVDDLPLKAMKLRLAPWPDLPQNLITSYDLSSIVPEFTDMLLSKGAITVKPEEMAITVTVCHTCFTSLNAGEDDSKMPPRLCIANHFAIGLLPQQLFDSSWPEHVMTKPVTCIAKTTVLRGGQNRALTSHMMCFDASPGPMATVLPRTNLNDTEQFHVIFAGAFTTDQKVLASARYKIRHSQINRLLNFYTDRENDNPDYMSVEWDHASLERDGVLDNAIPDGILHSLRDDDDECHEQMARDMSSVARDDEQFSPRLTGDNLNIIQNDSLFIQTAGLTPTQQIDSLAQSHGLYVARSSNKISMSDHHGSIFSKMFPELFPYGRGHPGEERNVKVSVHECVKYYLDLTSRRFAQHRLFLMAAFDHLSMGNMFMATSLACKKQSASFHSKVAQVTGEELQEFLKGQEIREKLYRQGRGAEVESYDRRTGAALLLNGVNNACSRIWGTNEERVRGRDHAFAMSNYFGLPQIFFTITPNMNGSFTLAYYSGNINIDSLTHADIQQLPGRVELFSISSKNPVACGKLYSRLLDIVLDVLLGFDTKTKRPHQRGGIFGHVRAYAGSTETQGTGNLHFHCLVWLYGLPRTLADLENALNDPVNGDVLRQRIIDFADSVVSQSLPFDIRNLPCELCGEIDPIDGVLDEQDVPEFARESPSVSGAKTAPIMARCRHCQTGYSSQKINENLLKYHRPLRWPQRSVMIQSDRSHKMSELDALWLSSRLHEASLESHDDLTNEELQYLHDLVKSLDDVPDVEPENTLDLLYADKFLQEVMCLPQGPDISKLDAHTISYLVTQIVLIVNNHRWKHAKSCFKSSVRTQAKNTASKILCRYLFPHERVPKTTFEDSCLVLRRLLGSEYINGFNSIIALALRCNHDVQILIGGYTACDRVFYTFKYTFKEQQSHDSKAAVQLASFQRRLEKERDTARFMEQVDLPLTDEVLARRRIAGLSVSTTNKQEIAAPLCDLYIREGIAARFSHETSMVYLAQFIKILTEETYEAQLIEVTEENNEIQEVVQRKFVSTETLPNYTERGHHESLNALPLYFWSSQWMHARMPANFDPDDDQNGDFIPYCASHSKASTHGLQKRKIAVIPNLKGPRLADVDELDSENDREQFAQIALILFKPFRSLHDLTGGFDSWWLAYKAFQPLMDVRSQLTMQFMQDYHICRSLARDKRTLQGEGLERQFDEDGMRLPSRRPVPDDQVEYDDLVTMFMADSSKPFEFDALNPALFPSTGTFPKTAELVKEMEQNEVIDGPARAVTEQYNDRRNALPNSLPQPTMLRRQEVDISSILLLLKERRNDLTLCDNVADSDIAHDVVSVAALQLNIEEVQTSVTLIEDALLGRYQQWTNRPSPQPGQQAHPDALPTNSFIETASHAFYLNEKQHIIFTLCARAMLSTWLYAIKDSDAKMIPAEQFLGFLGGEGGTGKSRVIHALRAFAISWQRSHAVRTIAMTGKAAVNVGGDTAHGLLGFSNLVGNDDVKMSESSKLALCNLDLLIIDECSMLTKKTLARIDIIMRWARPHDLPYGGCHVLLAGDFFQLPPTKGLPLYVDIGQYASPTEQEICGYELWRRHDKVVVLTENKRQEGDPDWGQGCRQARKGIWTPAFVDLINTRYIRNKEICEQFSHSQPLMLSKYQELIGELQGHSYAPFITPSNKARQAIINSFTKTCAKTLPPNHFPVRVVARLHTPKKNGQTTATLSRAHLSYIMSRPDNETQRMPAFIDCIIGMPVMVTQTISKAEGIVNGTIGTLYDICFEQDTQFVVMTDTNGHYQVRVPDRPPLLLLIRVHKPRHEPFPGLPDDVYPLAVQTVPGCSLTLPNTSPKFNFKITQFPCVCAAASSVYKIQGDSLQRIVVANWSAKNRADKPQQGYVIVSRALTRQSFFTLQELTPELLTYFQPPSHALAEDQRLQTASDRLQTSWAASLIERN